MTGRVGNFDRFPLDLPVKIPANFRTHQAPRIGYFPSTRGKMIFRKFINFDDLEKKSLERWFRKKLQMQGAQKLRSEAHLQVRCNDEVATQRSRWTFYKTINF
jgi:hypothetical protein